MPVAEHSGCSVLGPVTFQCGCSWSQASRASLLPSVIQGPSSFRLTFAGSFMSSLFTWQMGDRARRAARGGLTPLPVEVTCFTSFHTASARDQLPDPNLCVERLGNVFRCGKRVRVRQVEHSPQTEGFRGCQRIQSVLSVLLMLASIKARMSNYNKFWFCYK